MYQITLYLPHGGKRDLSMPEIPRVGDHIYFIDSEGLGDISEGNERRLRITNVTWSGSEAKLNDEWRISINSAFDEVD